MTNRQPLPASLYADTARPKPPEARLEGDAMTRIAIIGGGFTGLSTAVHLAKAGVEALVLEANEVGWGASGRNGGQVNPGLKWDPDALEAGFGADLGGRMVALGNGAPDLVFQLIEEHAIACDAVRGGTIRAAVKPKSHTGVRTYAEQWRARGAPVDLIEREDAERITGTDHYPLAAHDRRGGAVNPLSYARGLAEAAIKAGASIVSGARAIRLSREGGGWLVETPTGDVRADKVVLATNGYSDDLWPGLRRSIIPVFSSIAATEPLSGNLAASILPGRASLYELSSAYSYYRMDAEGRLLMGGRSVMRPSSDFSDYRGLIRHAERLFPALRGARWSHCWNGQTAITPDQLPHIHEPEAGMHIALGYNGRGVAMATAVGRMLARRVAGGSAEALDLPVTKIRPITGHVAWPLAVSAKLKWAALLERLER